MPHLVGQLARESSVSSRLRELPVVNVLALLQAQSSSCREAAEQLPSRQARQQGHARTHRPSRACFRLMPAPRALDNLHRRPAVKIVHTDCYLCGSSALQQLKKACFTNQAPEDRKIGSRIDCSGRFYLDEGNSAPTRHKSTPTRAMSAMA